MLSFMINDLPIKHLNMACGKSNHCTSVIDLLGRCRKTITTVGCVIRKLSLEF